MNQLDFDRAFPQTPECIHTAIELGIRKGKNKMKFRNKILSMGSIAAVFAVVIAAALAMGTERPPQPDVLTQPPLNAPALAGPESAGMLAQPQQEVFTVYVTEKGHYYHLEEHCSGMENAAAMTEPEAMQLSKTPCPVCIPLSCSGHDREEITFVYYSQGGVYFHKSEECSGGTFALKGDYFDVTTKFPEKKACPACFPEGIEACVHGRAFMGEAEEPEATAAPLEADLDENGALSEEYVPLKSEPASAAADIVYTEYGANLTSYHRQKNCAGREFPREISLMQANREKLQPCEACYFGYVCYTQNGTYYHSDPHCQGMQNAKQHSREDARRNGKFPCPLCLNVYCTVSGRYFHLLPDCSGMMGAELRSLEEAYALNKTRCPVCLSPETVYCTPKGAYFHAVQDCSGMEGASPTDPGSAWNMDKEPCPVCITGLSHAMLSRNRDSEEAGSAQNLAVLHEQLFQTAFGFLPEAKAQGYRFEEYSTEPYCWHLTDGESYPLSSALYLPGDDYDGYRIHLYSGVHPTVMRQIMEQVAVSPMKSMYSLAVHGLKNHVINQGHSFSERNIDIQNILVKFDDAQRICGASIDFFYNQKIVSVIFTPESKDYLSWDADVEVNKL